jgi:transposase, IS30 family
MGYHQLTQGERYTIARMRSRRHSMREIAACLGRSASTVSRELWRNRSVHDGFYRVDKAQSKATARRSKSRKKSQFRPSEWTRIVERLRRYWSPKQIVGRRGRLKRRPISHETIYRYVRRDRLRGGDLWRSMRHMSKIGRKHRGSPATRGILEGKRHISERPPEVELREELGHFEGDTVMGSDGRHCIVTLVERVTGYLLIKKLSARNAEQAAAALARMVIGLKGRIKTITLDNGTEFHGYKSVQDQFGVEFFFATPYRSWERGSNENTNGLVRQYLPKGTCLRNLTQAQCNWVAKELNDRPRERLGFQTPAEAFLSRP